MTTTLKPFLSRMVELSRTNAVEAIEALHEAGKQAADWRDRQQVELAIRHAERNAAEL